jgi:transposase
MSEPLRIITALGLTGPITRVLGHARCQHNAAVKALALQLGIKLLFLPSYSPNLNLIERRPRREAGRRRCCDILRRIEFTETSSGREG